MTEVGEGECKSQKEVRAPTTDNDMNECINKYAKDHIKAPNEWNEDVLAVWKMQYFTSSTHI